MIKIHKKLGKNRQKAGKTLRSFIESHEMMLINEQKIEKNEFCLKFVKNGLNVSKIDQ